MEELLLIIRSKGWRVAVHNDYSQEGKDYTFWLFAKGNVAVKGEGPTDEHALKIIASHPLINGTYPTPYEHARWFNVNPGHYTDDEAVASLVSAWSSEDLRYAWHTAKECLNDARERHAEQDVVDVIEKVLNLIRTAYREKSQKGR